MAVVTSGNRTQPPKTSESCDLLDRLHDRKGKKQRGVVGVRVGGVAEGCRVHFYESVPLQFLGHMAE